ncbi:hypothetical protein E2C01_003180 [Portunus trituberculatus]|uniref:Uncharacterized protein n=1 Tax=Portunus trituberculatus TaxID=210409 RepID=A0A5B7CSV1_PORTR|nr:hypothetical protein [Portunus trituberculatus]
MKEGMVSLHVPLKVAAPIAGEGAVVAGVRLGPRVNPEMAAEGGAAGEVSATRLTEQGVGGVAGDDDLPAHRLQRRQGAQPYVRQ